MMEMIDSYRDKFESVAVAEPLLGEVGSDATVINSDKEVVAKAVTEAAVKDAGYESLDETDSVSDEGESQAHRTMAFECQQPRPDELAEQREFLLQTLARIDALPVGLRDVMHLRVLQDQPTDIVCRSLDISEDNLFVRLHRARKQLLS